MNKKNKYDINNIHLKDCPYCGGKAIIVSNPGKNWDKKIKHVNIGALHMTWYVGCPSQFFEYTTPDCEIQPSASWYASVYDAIKQWNKRK